MGDQFLKDLQRGDARAFKILWDNYFALIKLFSFRIIGDEPEAEDIASHALSKFWEQELSEYNSLNKVSNFLYNVAKNSSIDYLRKQKTKNATLEQLARLLTEEEEYSIERSRYEVAMVEAIYREIDKLPPKTQRVFKLVYIHGIPAKEVATQLNISPTTVHRLCSEARQKLRKKFPEKQFMLLLFFFLSNN